MTTGRATTRPALCALTLLISVATFAHQEPTAPAPSPSPSPRPNIVLIVLDDLDGEAWRVMDTVQARIVGQGTSFRQHFVSVPLCCPSRASILTGQYAHNHGVFSNVGRFGGVERFDQRKLAPTALPVWLQKAGYRTALVGKYLNHYSVPRGKRGIPPGWDEWHAILEDRAANNSYYWMNDQGKLSKPDEYQTDRLGRLSAEFIESSGARPFFLYIAPGAPHMPADPSPRHAELFPGAMHTIDVIHVVEKLWSAGECLHAEGSDALARWVGEQTARLRRGSPKAVLRTLFTEFDRTPKQGPGNKGKRLRLSKAMDYFGMHLHRMRYAQMRRQDLDIGTGAVEGAVRNLVGLRLDGPGMRWSRQRSERVLHMRCVLINGQWGAFTEHLAWHDRLTLPARPEPAQPHTAAA